VNKSVFVPSRSVILATGLAVLAMLAMDPALAQSGGLEKVNSFLETVLSILRGASIAVVTIAIIWAGYKFLFKHADVGEVAKILGGGLLIGGAAEIARFLLGNQS